MPKGRPTTSTERMRLKKLRDQGKLPPIKTCSTCGKKLKEGAGSNRAYEAGLCWEHWVQTDEGRITRRRSSLVTELWPLIYIGTKDLIPFTSIRKCLSAGKGEPIYVVWSDGRVTLHLGLTTRTVARLKPEDGDQLIDDFQDFLDMVPEDRRAWFDH